MAKYLSYSGLEKVWGLAKNYFPTVKTATSNGADVSWTTNTGVISGNIATFSVDAEGLVKLQGITPDSLTAHTHSLSIATDSGDSQLDMDANTTYKLTAGGSTFIFKTPAHQAHQTLGLIVGSSATATSESGTRGNTTTFVNLLGGGALKDSVQFTGEGSVSVSGANGKVTITGAHQDWGLVAAGSSGTSNASVSDPYINLVKGSTPTFDSGVQLKGSNNVTVSSASGAITISGLANTVTGSSLTANQILLGNGNSTVKASGKTIVTTLGNDDTTIPTSKAVSEAISGLSGAMHFCGTTTTTLTDGATAATLAGSGLNKTTGFVAGDVVIYDSKEFVWTGSVWELFGDEGSYALKTVTITGTGALDGGGAISSNQTITHKTILATGSADTTYGPGADVSGANAIDIPYLKLDSYGHVKEIGKHTYTGPSVGSGKLQVKGSGSGVSATDTGFTANSSGNGVITFARSGASVSSVTTSGGTVTINGVDSLKNPNSLTIGTKPSSTGTATNSVVYDGSESGKAIYFSTAAASTTNVKFAIDSNGFITGTVTDSGNTHYASSTIIGASNSATSNAAVAAGTNSLFLNHIENGAVTSSHNIVGSGFVTVASDANGKMTINGAISNNVTYTGTLTANQVATWNNTTGQLKASGYTIATSVPSGAVFTDTKNTAGSTAAAASTIYYIVGASTQGDNPQTYSSNKVYFKDGVLYSNGAVVASDMEAISDSEINSVCIL